MGRVLLPQDIKLIPSFFTHYQHVHELIFFRDIVQNTIVAQTKFPRRHRIKTQEFDATRFLRGLMAEVQLDAIEDDPLGVSSEPPRCPAA